MKSIVGNTFKDLNSNPDGYTVNKWLKKIVLPNGITNIGEYSFASYEALSEINVPDSVTEIGHSVFWECSNLVRVRLPYGLKHIGVGAFRGCDKLSELSIPNSVTTIGGQAFADTSIKKIITPNGITSISDGMYYSMPSLEEVIIHDNVTEIRAQAFAFSSLKRIRIPKSVTKILNDDLDGETIIHACKAWNMQECPLSRESIISVINALSNTTSKLTVTFKKTAINNAFGIDVDDETTYPEGSEYYALRNTKSNWTFSYV